MHLLTTVHFNVLQISNC